MGEPAGGRRRRAAQARMRAFAALTAIAATVSLALAAPAAAQLEITDLDGEVTASSAGDPYTQAGGHPYDATTWIEFAAQLDSSGTSVPVEDVKDLHVELPPGFVGNPTLPACTQAEFAAGLAQPLCKPESLLGIATVRLFGVDFPYPVFNLESAADVPATFGFRALNLQPVILMATVRSAGDYGVSVDIPNTSQGVPLTATSLTLWGVPADPSHDVERESLGDGYPLPASAPETPFLTLPTRCTPDGVGLETSLSVNSWPHPDDYGSASFFSHLPPAFPTPPLERGPQQGPTDCDRVPFEAELTARPQSSHAGSPTGFQVDLAIAQDGLLNPDGVAPAHLKRAEVVLPEGMAVSPSAAMGLGACSPAQIGLGSTRVADCPDSSKLGTVEVATPLLEERLRGDVFLASQRENPFGSLLALYIVAEGSGLVFKLPGKVTADPATGRLTAIFDDNPQLPFSRLSLRFKSGDRAALVTPPTCGSYEIVSRLSPWSAADPGNPSAEEVVTSRSSFQITSGPNGKPCPNGSFEPKLSAGTTSPIAGDYSPFVLGLSREDGTQLLGGLSLTLPAGLTGKLAGIPYCPETVVAAVPVTEGAAAAQLASPTCPQASQIGTVSAGAGAGSNPFYVDTGKVYLAGAYKGAPLSMAIVTPVIAGPFDLGNVVVRAALRVDPTTAQITAVSDPLPSILHGVPLDLRDIRVDVDRQKFTLNPTDCKPMAIVGSASSPGGSTASLSERFQVTNCAALPFKPKLKLSINGPTRRGAHPRLRAVLTMPKGGANIDRAQVTLPRTEFLENANIRTICTRVQYAAGPGGGRQCPEASVYGYARAWTPLLDKPLQGPVYLRSSNNPLPDLIASLDGQIHVDLVGRIDSVDARIRNTFETVPDAPVSKFVLEMQGRQKGLLVNSTELCRTTARASVKFHAQNGKIAGSNPVMQADCGKGRGKGRGGRQR